MDKQSVNEVPVILNSNTELLFGPEVTFNIHKIRSTLRSRITQHGNTTKHMYGCCLVKRD